MRTRKSATMANTNATERTLSMSAASPSNDRSTTTPTVPLLVDGLNGVPVIRADSVILGNSKPGKLRVVYIAHPGHTGRPSSPLMKRSRQA